MDWKVFFEKELMKHKRSPRFHIFIAPKHTSAMQELKNQKIIEIREDCLVTTSTISTSGSQSFVQYEDIYYVYLDRECLIVTAAVGSRHAIEVVRLKTLRDDYIQRSFTYYRLIKNFDRIYYLFSPTVARAMLVNPSLKVTIRKLLVIPFVKIAGILQSRVVRRRLIER